MDPGAGEPEPLGYLRHGVASPHRGDDRPLTLVGVAALLLIEIPDALCEFHSRRVRARISIRQDPLGGAVV